MQNTLTLHPRQLTLDKDIGRSGWNDHIVVSRGDETFAGNRDVLRMTNISTIHILTFTVPLTYVVISTLVDILALPKLFLPRYRGFFLGVIQGALCFSFIGVTLWTWTFVHASRCRLHLISSFSWEMVEKDKELCGSKMGQ